VKYACIEENRGEFEVVMMCRVVGVARSGYYAWRTRGMSARQQANVALVKVIRDVHEKSRRTYGSPRMYRELRARGMLCGKHRVARLMKEQAIRPKQKRRFVVTTDSAHVRPIAGNHLDRKFDVKTPNTVWAGDITYIPTRQGWLYLAVVLDLASRRVVGWSMGESLERELVIKALQMAVARRRPAAGLIMHTDRGSQYASEENQALLSEHGMRCSMSRKGNCWDNAVTESFFGSLKTELIEGLFPSRAAARAAVFEYIEVWYNRLRRHSTLGYLSPMAFERNAA
jgi:putative transposase